MTSEFRLNKAQCLWRIGTYRAILVLVALSIPYSFEGDGNDWACEQPKKSGGAFRRQIGNSGPLRRDDLEAARRLAVERPSGTVVAHAQLHRHGVADPATHGRRHRS